jgi:hypothetical protein
VDAAPSKTAVRTDYTTYPGTAYYARTLFFSLTVSLSLNLGLPQFEVCLDWLQKFPWGNAKEASPVKLPHAERSENAR